MADTTRTPAFQTSRRPVNHRRANPRPVDAAARNAVGGGIVHSMKRRGLRPSKWVENRPWILGTSAPSQYFFHHTPSNPARSHQPPSPWPSSASSTPRGCIALIAASDRRAAGRPSSPLLAGTSLAGSVALPRGSTRALGPAQFRVTRCRDPTSGKPPRLLSSSLARHWSGPRAAKAPQSATKASPQARSERAVFLRR